MKKYIYMTLEKMEFSDKEKNKFIYWLGINNANSYIFSSAVSLVSLIVLSSITIALVAEKHLYFFLILPLLISISIFLFLIKRPSKKKIDIYKKVMNEVYDSKLIEYEGYSRYILGYNPNLLVGLKSKTLLMVTDGYKFIFMNDFFKDTGYKFKDGSNLKIISNNSLLDKKFSFMINDVLEYKLEGNILNLSKNICDISFDNVKNYSFVTVVLKDYKVIKLSSNVYEVFKNSIPTKEVKYEK